MWPETLNATSMLNNSFILRVIGKFAKWIYKQASAICVISPGFRNNLIKKDVPAEHIYFIPNWVDTEIYQPACPDRELAEKLGLSEKFNVMFAGNMGEAQGLETVLDAASVLEDLEDLQFVMVGDGTAFSDLREKAEAKGLTNVLFLGRYPAASMSSLYALADVLLVHLRKNPLFEITIPHKVFSYMASSKPILAAVAGDAADLVSEVGAGITCPPQDSEALALTVRRFYELPELERRKMARNGLKAVNETFNRENLVEQIEVLLRSVVSMQE
jgi:glycosyltransferase involved in cell wall biosynthesis